ncbi:NAD(P)/FAD-dependent oxidoreductase [Actinomadura luteofluorescens]|uniref:Thioredoxin reductase (NADPH) n=1 Tax=Actinomadura luteofluorescens TaxID=46163 RepID=A0A7Y9ELI2_9ACTN|nr:NAD(P)/FAD-dependent oxidoreductase [Actinomadura luteofluorescens]NYD49965.1 thioredoxin reductase (NADPH) [Actinomadura luteofluorescens]
MSDDEYDVAVVGAGAAGLNAALVLARARRRVAVVDAGEPRNAPAAHMQGFLSRDGMPPAALLDVGRAEVAGYGAALIGARVEHVDPGFTVRLVGGAVLSARRLVVATGLRDELPGIPGVAERWGRDVLHCPYCHGYEVRDQPLGVLGTSPGAVHQALLLRQWSEDVVLFAHTLELDEEERERLTARGVRLVEGEVKRVVADDRVRGVELAGGRTVPRRAVFLFPRMVPRDALLTGLGCAVEDGRVVTDRTGRTTVPGVWAVGNVTDPRAQVVTAAGMGSAAAIALNADLLDEDVHRAMDQHRAVDQHRVVDQHRAIEQHRVGGGGR